MRLLPAFRELVCIKGDAISLRILSLGAPRRSLLPAVALTVPRVTFRFHDTAYVKCTLKKVHLLFYRIGKSLGL
jgi:hypothetical protein